MWKFDQDPDCGVITTKGIMNEVTSILYVFHDLDDHGWQFLSGNSSHDDFAIITLQQIVSIDPSINDVAHIEPGWKAYRASENDEWIIEKNH